MDAIRKATTEELSEVEGIGPGCAKVIRDALQESPAGQESSAGKEGEKA